LAQTVVNHLGKDVSKPISQRLLASLSVCQFVSCHKQYIKLDSAINEAIMKRMNVVYVL